MSAPATIDLNADLGESFGRWRLGDDEAMLDLVTSANIACGFHAGDPLTLQRTCAAAVERGVVIGAQVGYDDLAGFGRRAMEIPSDELTAGILYQLGALDGLARVAGGRVRYVKPHGALYAAAAVDERQARAVVAAVTAYGGSLPVLSLPGSVLLAVAEEAGVPTVREAFADRGYTATGTLVPRSQPGAFVEDPELAGARMRRLATTGEVSAIDGSVLTLRVDSVCVHGDSPTAVDTARAVRRELSAAGVLLSPFAS